MFFLFSIESEENSESQRTSRSQLHRHLLILVLFKTYADFLSLDSANNSGESANFFQHELVIID